MNRKLIAWLLATIMVLTVFACASVPVSAAGPQKTQLTIYAPVNVYSLQWFDITGKLVAGTGAGVPGITVSVYRSVNGKTWNLLGTSQTDAGGNYKVPTSESTGGKYMYRAQFPGGKVYMPATSAKATVTVDAKKATTITINAPASLYTDEMCTLRAYLKDAAGNPISGQQLECKMDGPGLSDKTTVQTAADGLACKSYIGLAAGQYTIHVTFYGTAGYAPTSGIAAVEVKEKPLTATTLTLNQPNWAYAGEPMTFTGTLTAADNAVMYGKDVHIQIYNPDTKKYEDLATTATDGVGAFRISKVLSNIGTYQVKAVYDGGDGYAGDTSTAYNVEVKFNPRTTLTYTLSPNPAYCGDMITSTVVLTDYNGVGIPNKDVMFQVYDDITEKWWDYTLYHTDGSGICTDTSTAPSHAYTSLPYRYHFEGVDGYASATSNEIIHVTNPKPTMLELYTNLDRIISGEPFTYNVKLTDSITGLGIPDRTVKIQWYTGATWDDLPGVTGKTDSSGVYTYALTITGSCDIKLRSVFAGDGTYEGKTSSEFNLVVEPSPTTLDLTITPSSVVNGQTSIFNGKLADTNGVGIPEKTITLEYHGDTGYNFEEVAITGTSGEYQYTFIGTTIPGIYTVTAVFEGDIQYASATSKVATWEVKDQPKLAVPTGLSPAEGAVFERTQNTITLTWDPVTGADHYMIDLEYDDGGWHAYHSPWASEASLTYQFSAFYPTRWRVTAYDGTGVYGVSDPSAWSYFGFGQPIATDLTLTVSPNPATSGEPITFGGTLKDVNDVGIPGQTITLEFTEVLSGNVIGSQTAETGTSGEYQYIAPFDARADFKVKATFDGADTYAGSASQEIPFTVNPVKLSTPTLVSPADGTVFDIYPRTTTVTWDSVPYADSYLVEVQGQNVVGGLWFDWWSYTVTGTSYTFDFAGMQPGRWRVTALDSTGIRASSDPSDWRGFSYTI